MSMNAAFVVLSTTTMANGTTIFSSSYPTEYASGFNAVLITMAGTPNVTVTQQVSVAGSVWHDPVNSVGSVIGAVLSAGTSTVSYYIQFTQVFARYSRFKVVAAADSTIGITVVMSEQSPN